MASKLEQKYLCRVGRIQSFWYLLHGGGGGVVVEQQLAYLLEQECMVKSALLVLSNLNSEATFFPL